MTVRQTSVEAYKDLDLPSRQEQVYKVVDRFGPGTARELFRRAGGMSELGVYSGFQPRLKELEEQGFVDRKSKKTCSVTGRTAGVWRLRK